MSKKKLLEESTIRSFMKLANLQPLTARFLKEAEEAEVDESQQLEEEEEEEEEEDARESLEEVSLEEEGDLQEEGKESDGRPSSPKQKVKGVSKPTKMQGVSASAQKSHKLSPAKTGDSRHTSSTDTINTSHHSVARKKNNSQFTVQESMDEAGEEMEAPEGAEGMEAPEGAGGEAEGGDHQEKMKGLIRDMLTNLQEMGGEYGVQMEISDDGGSEGEGDEEPPPEDEEAGPPETPQQMQEKMNRMLERLTTRVSSRLIKESKKRR